VRALELFGGGGGAWQGLTAAGVEVVRSIEWDSAAHEVAVAAGCPSVQGDVRDLSLLEGLGPVGLVWSSFPCQSFSSAGNREGASDPRNGWPWTLGVVDEVGPRWFMGENVMGLTQHSSEWCGNPQRCPGCYLHQVILPELRERFEWVGWSVSDAADFGVPQRRRRVCIVAGPRAIRWPAATHAAPEKCLGLFSRWKPWACPEWWDAPSPTVMTNEVKGSGPGANPHKMQRASDALYLGTGRRRLTVSECRVLMGWAPEYDEHLGLVTKTDAYRILGNGCVPAWVEAHVRAVLEADSR